MVKVICLMVLFPILLNAQNKIEILNKNNLTDLISKRQEKILILNVWATWCVPCREEIPALNKLQKEYSAEAEVIGISVDYPDEIKTRILPFLQEQKIKYKILVNSMKDEELINFFPVKWSGAVPATFIYDKYGKLNLFLEGKKKFEVFDKAVKDLLK